MSDKLMEVPVEMPAALTLVDVPRALQNRTIGDLTKNPEFMTQMRDKLREWVLREYRIALDDKFVK
jgi:hypothetical protein